MVAQRVLEPLEIHIDPDSETGKLLAQASERPLRLVSNGARYRVEPLVRDETDAVTDAEADPNDPWADYDPERAKAAVRAFAEADIFHGVDIEELKRELKEQRGQHSIGRPEW